MMTQATMADRQRYIRETVPAMGKRIALPDVTTFGELFAHPVPWVFDSPADRAKRKADPYYRADHERGVPFNPDAPFGKGSARMWRDTSMIGTFLTVVTPERRESYDVEPSAAVIDAIRTGTIDCGMNDTFSFEVIDHGDGLALAVAKHGLIIGSLWLAYIDTDSLPQRPVPSR